MNIQTQPGLPSWALFVSGIAAIAAMFYWGFDHQDLSIRVTLALAAAGVASYIPGFLQINSQTVRAGGALGVLVLVMFADNISAGFAPDSKIAGIPTNVKFNKDQLQYQSEIAAAQFDITQGRRENALDILNHAKTLNPNDSLAQLMIGSINMELENYTGAAEAFERGYNIDTAGKGRFAYNLALAHDAVGETELAKKWIDVARDNAPLADYPALRREIVYDRGLIYLVAWKDTDAPKRTKGFEVAAGSFNEFLDQKPRYLHWADYHLACLYASLATNESGRSSDVTTGKMVDYFDRFLRRIRSVDPVKIDYHLNIARRVLSLPTADRESVRGPLEPIECPEIKKVWQGATTRPWDDVVKVLLPPSTRQANLL